MNLEEKIDNAAKELIRSFKGKDTLAHEKENKKLQDKLEKFKQKHKQRLMDKKIQYEQKINEQKQEYKNKIEQMKEEFQQKITTVEDGYKQKIYTMQTTGQILKIKNDAYEEGANSLRPALQEYKSKCQELEQKLAKYQSQTIKKAIKTAAYTLLAVKIAATAIFAGYYIAQSQKTKEYTTSPASSPQR